MFGLKKKKKNPVVDLPIKLQCAGKPGTQTLSPMGDKDKDPGAASQTVLLTGVRLRLQGRVRQPLISTTPNEQSSAQRKIFRHLG